MREGNTSEMMIQGIGPIAIANAATYASTQISTPGPWWPRWNIQPTDSSETVCTAVPTMSNGLRPALSTNASATNVKTKLIAPTQTADAKALSVLPPAALNTSGA